jgi:hypothetical protein
MLLEGVQPMQVQSVTATMRCGRGLWAAVCTKCVYSGRGTGVFVRRPACSFFETNRQMQAYMEFEREHLFGVSVCFYVGLS